MVENDAENRLFYFLFDCFTHEEFKKTRFACKLGGFGLISTFVYYNFFNSFHPAKNLVISAVGIGSIINVLHTFSTEIFIVAKTDTPLANKLRLYHQDASYSNVFIPFFKGETLRTFKKREVTENKREEDSVYNKDN
jgi:hypothetical protein